VTVTRQQAEHEPVARVLPMLSVPHLDRDFDYLVPADLSDDAQPGVWTAWCRPSGY
jgi:primosomal protein N' (replication factor Y)